MSLNTLNIELLIDKTFAENYVFSISYNEIDSFVQRNTMNRTGAALLSTRFFDIDRTIP